MSKGRILFVIATVVFIAIVAFFVWDMSRQTSKPWGKPKKEKKDIF